jgi:glycosyltransferase involved in cell wall biosynthesis
MTRGIDTNLFTPDRRTRNDDEFVIGYVGRLSPEKDVRQFVEMERQLRDAGIENYRFLIVGDGSDRAFLAEHLHRADLPGVLRGEELARAYANMDVFLFPSETDTFGNVVLEALSSGVPAIVSGGGGPQYIVQDGSSGFRAASMEDRVEALAQLYRDSALRQRMSHAARQRAFAFSWSAVFENVYSKYGEVLGSVAEASRTYPVQTPSPGTAY